MKPIKSIAPLLLGMNLFANPAGAESAVRPPNFVVIVCDDMGWGDLGCYGHSEIKTPNLDRLAEQGTRLTHFYVNSSVCSPTRTGIMTGRFPSELAVHGHFASIEHNIARGMPNFLDAELPMITRLLKSGGYATGHFGKWHLGGPQDPMAPPPEAYGIDVSATVLSNGATYDETGDKRAISSERIMKRTLDFIEANREKPFFINCWIIDPHAILAPSPEQMSEYEHLAPIGPAKDRFTSTMQTYYSVITDVDKQVGKLMDHLDELGLADDTIVVFTSDNGPADIWVSTTSHSGAGLTGPFRGCKTSLYEGGIRMPFIVRWPGKVAANVVDNTTVMSAADFLPSFCKLAGVELSNDLTLNGEDLSAVFQGQPVERIKPLMWEYRYEMRGRHIQHSPMLAMRENQWKILLNPDRSRVELYNLSDDPSEVDNRAADHPVVAARMSKMLLDWYSTLPNRDKVPADAGTFEYPWPVGK